MRVDPILRRTGRRLAHISWCVATTLTLLLAASTAHATSAAHYTYRHGGCESTDFADPLNVQWFNVDWVSVKVGLEEYMRPWGPLQELPFGSQYAYDYSDHQCKAANYSSGRQWGPTVAPGFKKYKFHVRLFTTGSGAVGTGAHIERKRRIGRCTNNVAGMNDAVFVTYNGRSGFDAAMEKVVDGYAYYSSSSISIVRSRTPFTHLFRQCDDGIVRWSGRVAYITRPGP